MGMIRLSGKLICQTHAEARAVAMALPDHIRLTLAEAGCLSFEVTPTADPFIWQVSESFVDRAAFDAHQTRTATSDWAAQTAAIKRDFSITEGDAE